MRRLVVIFLMLMPLGSETMEYSYAGGGFFRGDGSRGFSKSDPNYEEYDTVGMTYKRGGIIDEYQSFEGSLTAMDAYTELENHVLFLGIDFDYIVTPYERQENFITPFISIGLGAHYFAGDTDNNNSTYEAAEGLAINGKVGLYFSLGSHLEIEAHMHGKSFLWNSAENETGEAVLDKADSMTNFYLGINWHH